MQTQIRLLLKKVFSVCYSDKHFVNSSPLTNFLFENRKRKVFKIIGHLQYLYSYFNRYDSTLNDILDPQYASVESKMDSRIQSKYLGNEAVLDVTIHFP